MAKLANWTLALALATAATGCLDFSDNEGPIMSIELFWDERPDGSRLHRRHVRERGVETMQWSLRNSNGKEVATRKEACANGIDVVDPKPGTYHLQITGSDEEQQPGVDRDVHGLERAALRRRLQCDICDADHPEGCK